MPEEAKEPTKVFISYSWDSEEHQNNVLRVANTLRNPWGVETDIDQYVRAKPPFTPLQGWDLWMEKRIEWAEFVLIVCTETYRRRFRNDEKPEIGRGVTWEGTIIRQQLYIDKLNDTKFIPVVFSSQDLVHVPQILNAHDKYILDDEKSFRTLGFRLRKQPIVLMPEVAVGNLPLPSQPEFFSHQKPSIKPPPVSSEIDQIQAPSVAQKEAEEAAEQERIQREQRQAEAQDRKRQDAEKERQAEQLRQRQAAKAARKQQQERAKQPSPDAPKGNYTQLEVLLKAGKWKEADQETAKKMCEVMGRQKEGWLRVEDIEQFPCTDLRTIDQLWVKYSKGKFGFSVQKKIWQQCGSPTGYNKQWEQFGVEVGWRTKGIMGMGAEWKAYSEVAYDTSAPRGHLPIHGRNELLGPFCDELRPRFAQLFSLAQTCKL